MKSRVRAVRTVALLALVAGGLGGCVSQGEYDALYDNNRSLTNRNQELLAQLEECNQTVAGLRGSQSGAESLMGRQQSENSTLRSQLTQARNTINDLEARLASLELGQIDPTTDQALARLAARFPRQIQYDPDRGMLRFASDLTFSSGSDIVRDEAKESIAALAEVLRMSEAQAYDVVIVGHTDSAKPSAGTQQRHPTNTHLSAHRAISVKNELRSMGIPAEKMQVAGWGEHRPVVPNSPDGNTPQNRRVEIFLVSSQYNFVGGTSPVPTTVNVDSDNPPASGFDPTK
ncbi:MAG: OmpA family protein [Phycisphaerales bacterium JB059]